MLQAKGYRIKTVTGSALAESFFIMKVAKLFIGLKSNKLTDVSAEVLKERSINIIADKFSGFNVQDSIGFWQGVEEPCIVVSIGIEQDDFVKVKYTIKLLCNFCGQESIAVEYDNEFLFLS